MRHIKSTALLFALALSTAATAQVSSTSTGYGRAESTVEASGTYASKVSFSLPAALLSIPSAQVRPGATFKVTIPVTNTTDRAITITAAKAEAPANVTVDEPTPVPAEAGAVVNLIYTITFAADAAQYASLSGSADFKFALSATDTAEATKDLTVK